ncbi:MAG TPA: ABC transporter substrate-binding protein [Candidatus Limnocylindria bacterium]|jgi:ABC-type nitrate/sulfonate/bicarbonate transport system substrate-binding protein|nr:ABC transporter substrate-binding protein [Candidatus Limnocylindria bacterium]
MRARLTSALVFVLVLGACGGGATPSPSASAATVASATAAAKATCQPTSVKIAVPVTPPNVVHLPPYVAQELGYFKDENLTVELVRFEGGVGALRSMASGGVNMAGTSTEPVITAISQGVSVRVVQSYSPNISQVFAVRDTIKTPADLKGKKIGIQEPGGFADALSRAYLKKVGINATDVQFVTTTTAARVQQLVSGGTDTAILHVDQVLAVKKTAPNIVPLVNMWDVLTDYQYAVYAVPTSEAKSALTECMLRAIMRANRAMYDPALRAQILTMAVRETKAERDVVEAAYKTLETGKAWPQNEGVPQKNVEGTVASLVDLKQIDRAISFADIADLTLANKIVSQLGKKDWPY